MKLEVNINKKTSILGFIFGLLVAGLIVGYAYAGAGGVGHDLTEIGPGTFNAGNYVFPSNSNVTVTADFKTINNSWGESTTAQYDNGVHTWQTKTATCPQGYYVVGITAVYGGTCRNECNSDGAVIRQLILDCRKL